MECDSDSPCCSHTYPGQGFRSPGRCSGWELEFRYCGAIPGRGLLLTVKRQIKGKRKLCMREEILEGIASGGKSSSHGSKGY